MNKYLKTTLIQQASPEPQGDPEWFKSWFNSKASIERYLHRGTSEAQDLVKLISTQLKSNPLIPLSTCLDAGCGRGRHIQFLQTLCPNIVGIDISLTALSSFKTPVQRKENVLLLNADLRSIPLRPSSVDIITSLFSSWGYLPSDGENRDIIFELARVLRSQGLIVLDLANSTYVLNHLEESSITETENFIFTEKRTPYKNNTRLRKDICVEEKFSNSENLHFFEDVRLFNEEEIRQMLELSGFRLADVYGTYTGRACGPDNPRIISFGLKL